MWQDRLKEMERVELAERKLEENIRAWGRDEGESEITEERSFCSSSRGDMSRERSRRGSSRGSATSVGSEDRLSNKEVNKLKRLMAEKDREERRYNVVVKGAMETKEGEKGRMWMQDFIKEKLGVKCKVLSCRRSGPVMVAKIDGEEKKREIMKNKNKLKGGKIFIENDLSWEERKLQVAGKNK